MLGFLLSSPKCPERDSRKTSVLLMVSQNNSKRQDSNTQLQHIKGSDRAWEDGGQGKHSHCLKNKKYKEQSVVQEQRSTHHSNIQDSFWVLWLKEVS